MTTRSLVWWGGVFMAVAAAQAGAQEKPATAESAVQTLTPLRVQGRKLETGLPEGSTITTRQQIDERAIESWEDFAKRGEPGVNFSTESNSVNIRGMDGDRVVTRVDGIRVPWLNDGARSAKGGLDSINFNSLSSIDLVRGAGSVQSGSLVGYLDLRSLSPDDMLAPDKDFGALLKSGYNSADDSFGADAALAGRAGQGSSWLLQAGQRDGHELENRGAVGGYGARRETANPEDYRQRNIMLKLQHALDEEHKLTLSGEAFRRESTIDNRREQGAPVSRFAIGRNSLDKEIERDRAVLGYEYSSSQREPLVERADVKLYWQRISLDNTQDAQRVSAPAGPYGRRSFMEESDVGLVAAWSGYLDTAVKQHWSAGAEWLQSESRQSSTGYDNCDVIIPTPGACASLRTNVGDMPRSKGRQWALWAQDEFSWDGGTYALTPALRFDSYSQKPKAGGLYSANPNAAQIAFSQSSDQAVSPSLLATYRPRQGLSFYAKYGYGFKAPNASQLYLNFGEPGSYLVVGNPDLKPEVSRGWELGMDLGDADRGARLSLYDTRYRDFIDRVAYAPGNPQRDAAWEAYTNVTQFANRARVRIHGAELSGHWAFSDNWYTWGSMAWTQGKDQDTQEYLNSVAPLKAIAALGYRADRWGAESILTMARRRGKVQYPQATAAARYEDFQAPGYGLVDLSAWWKPQAAKGLRLQAGVYNLFDKKYWNALDVPTAGTSAIANPIDSYTQPGRSLRVTLSYQY